MTDHMEELRDYLVLMAKQERDWHGPEEHDAKLFTAHTTSFGVILKPVDIPDFIWSEMSVGGALSVLPDALSEWKDEIPRAIGDSFFAWVVRTEAHVREVTPDEFDPRKEYSIRTHPEAKEVRQWSAASADGAFVIALTERDTSEVVPGIVIRPGDEHYDKARHTHANAKLLRAARVTEWALGRWPRKKSAG